MSTAGEKEPTEEIPPGWNRLVILKTRLQEAVWSMGCLGLLTATFTIGTVWAVSSGDFAGGVILGVIAGFLWSTYIAVSCYWLTR